MKKTIVALATVSALLLSACGSGDVQGEEVRADDNYVAVCVDPETGNRVDDSQCGTAPEYQDSNGSTLTGLFWGYIIANALMPSYGSHVNNYVTRVDDTRHNVYRGGVPRTGGYVNYKTYKPLASKVVKPNVSLKSDAYNYNYNKSPNYTRPSSRVDTNKSKNNGSYNKPANKPGGGYKAPAPAPRRK